MAEWHKTGCVLCAQNCGLEVRVEGNRIVKVRPDKENPRSEGYTCRKGLHVSHYQHHKQRLTHPLKRVGDGFRPIPWDQAIDEIADQPRSILDQPGPKSLACMGGGGQGCHFEAAFGVRLIRGLGSRYHYNALGQELTGSYWVWGRVLGRQNLIVGPDHHNSDPLRSYADTSQYARAFKHLDLLVTAELAMTETAQLSHYVLPARSAYESWDGTFFPWTYPGIFFQIEWSSAAVYRPFE